MKGAIREREREAEIARTGDFDKVQFPKVFPTKSDQDEAKAKLTDGSPC